MRILSKRKNHLLQFLNLTKKLNTGVAIERPRPTPYIPRSRELLLKTAGAGQHKKILMKTCNSDEKYSFSFLSGERSSWYGRLPNLPFPEEDLEVAPSCNGLLHLYSKSEPDGAVWNPSTSEIKFLPPSDIKRPIDTDYTTTSFSALGFDCKAQDYKILRYLNNYIDEVDSDEEFRDDGGRFFQIEMYSLKTDSWKEIFYEKEPRYGFCHCKPSVYTNGCYYWNGARHISAFDFAEETFFKFNFPHFDTGSLGLYEFELVEFDGSLGCIFFPVVGSRKTFELWVLKEGGLWNKEVAIKVAADTRLLGLMGNGQLLFLQNGDVKMYDCSTNRLKKLDHMCVQSEVTTETEFIPYVESKLPLAQQLATSNTSLLMKQ